MSKTAPRRAEKFSLDRYVDQIKHVLELERGEEQSEDLTRLTKIPPRELEERGLCLTKLVIDDISTGFFGRTLVTFKRAETGEPLPPHSFSVRDVVKLKALGVAPGTDLKDAFHTGVVYSVRPDSISVAFDPGQILQQTGGTSVSAATAAELDVSEVIAGADLSAQRVIYKTSNEVTYRAYDKALDELVKAMGRPDHPARPVLSVLFEEAEAEFLKDELVWQPVVPLNEAQREAIGKCLASTSVSLIHGPPGTGKTTAVAELIAQFVARGLRVLACAPSNIAADNLVERLQTSYRSVPVPIPRHEAEMETKAGKDSQRSRVSLNCVRLGHPARLLPSILERSLDSLVRHSNAAEVQSALRQDASKLRYQLLQRGGKSALDKNERRAAQRELKHIQRDLANLERDAAQNVLSHANVIVSTLTGASSSKLNDIVFDVIVIDEAAQALEVACLIPILKGRKLVLAGDHLQLPPTVQSNEAAAQGLACTLFERLLRRQTTRPETHGGDDDMNADEDEKQVDSAIGTDAKDDSKGDESKSLQGSKPRQAKLARVPSWLPRTHWSIAEHATTLLVEQYRMNEIIMRWSSDALYQGKLKAHPSVAFRLLTDYIPSEKSGFGAQQRSGAKLKTGKQADSASVQSDKSPVPVNPTTQAPWIFVDTAEADDCFEDDVAHGADTALPGGESRSNRGEAELVAAYVRDAIDGFKMAAVDVAVITPYTAQVKLLRELLHPLLEKGLEVGTVDGFQGREKDLIVISMVRSNETGEVGFLADDRRMNVAVTRARRQVVIFGNSTTISTSPFLEGLVDYSNLHGSYRSAYAYRYMEYDGLDETANDASSTAKAPSQPKKSKAPVKPPGNASAKQKKKDQHLAEQPKLADAPQPPKLALASTQPEAVAPSEPAAPTESGQVPENAETENVEVREGPEGLAQEGALPVEEGPEPVIEEHPDTSDENKLLNDVTTTAAEMPANDVAETNTSPAIWLESSLPLISPPSAPVSDEVHKYPQGPLLEGQIGAGWAVEVHWGKHRFVVPAVEDWRGILRQRLLNEPAPATSAWDLGILHKMIEATTGIPATGQKLMSKGRFVKTNADLANLPNPPSSPLPFVVLLGNAPANAAPSDPLLKRLADPKHPLNHWGKSPEASVSEPKTSPEAKSVTEKDVSTEAKSVSQSALTATKSTSKEEPSLTSRLEQLRAQSKARDEEARRLRAAQEHKRLEKSDEALREIERKRSEAWAQATSKVVTDDEDELETLESIEGMVATLRLGKCFVPGCKAKMHMQEQQCKHCRRFFCTKHISAFDHGCGREEKKFQRERAFEKAAKERSLFVAGGSTYAGNAVKPEKPLTKEEIQKRIAKLRATGALGQSRKPSQEGKKDDKNDGKDQKGKRR